MTSSHRTALSLVLVSGASFLQIVIQFLFFRELAGFYGASYESDALAAALVIPTVLAAMITGSISYVLVPELVARFEQDPQTKTAWQLAWFVGGITSLVSATVSLALLLWADGIIATLYPSLGEEEQVLTGQLLRILSIQVLLTGLISWAQSVHHSRHRFGLPAAGGVLGTGLALILAANLGSQGIWVFAWCINIGSLVSVIVHLAPMLPRLTLPRAQRTSVLLLAGRMWPLLAGAAFIRLDTLVDRILVSGLYEGSVAHINYAQRIIMALLTVGTSSLSVIVFPQLAQHLTAGGEKGFADHFALAWKRLSLIIVPICVGVGCFAVNIIRDLLERGEFTSNDSWIVGTLVTLHIGMFVGASAGELLARGFYSLGDTRTPTLVAALSLAIGFFVKFGLVQVLGIWGIPIGVSSAFLLSTCVMGLLLARRVDRTVYSGIGIYLVHAFVSTMIACGCCYLVYAGRLGSTWLAGPIGAVVYFACLLGIGNREAWQLVDFARGKLAGGA